MAFGSGWTALGCVDREDTDITDNDTEYTSGALQVMQFTDKPLLVKNGSFHIPKVKATEQRGDEAEIHSTELTPYLMESGGSVPHSQGLDNNSYT